MSEPKAKSGASKAGAPKAKAAAPKGGEKAPAAKAGADKTPAAKPKAEAKKPEPKAEAKKPEPAKAASAPKAAAKPDAGAAESAAADSAARSSFRRRLVGRVKSDKMDKTIVVEVVRSKMDPVYKKYVRVRKSYQAHDEENTCKVGDRVEIIEHRPLSKMKRWKLLNLVERAVQE